MPPSFQCGAGSGVGTSGAASPRGRPSSSGRYWSARSSQPVHQTHSNVFGERRSARAAPAAREQVRDAVDQRGHVPGAKSDRTPSTSISRSCRRSGVRSARRVRRAWRRASMTRLGGSSEKSLHSTRGRRRRSPYAKPSAPLPWSFGLLVLSSSRLGDGACQRASAVAAESRNERLCSRWRSTRGRPGWTVSSVADPRDSARSSVGHRALQRRRGGLAAAARETSAPTSSQRTPIRGVWHADLRESSFATLGWPQSKG